MDTANINYTGVFSIVFENYLANRRHPTNALFHDAGLLTVRPLFIRYLLIQVLITQHALLPEIPHSHNTRSTQTE